MAQAGEHRSRASQGMVKEEASRGQGLWGPSFQGLAGEGEERAGEGEGQLTVLAGGWSDSGSATGRKRAPQRPVSTKAALWGLRLRTASLAAAQSPCWVEVHLLKWGPFYGSFSIKSPYRGVLLQACNVFRVTLRGGGPFAF